jgi:hypothetical protein
MTAYFKTIKLFLAIVTCFALNLHAQKIITLDYCIYDPDNPNPVEYYDTVVYIVHVVVNDTSATNNDSMMGDLFYWYQTSLMVANSIPPRLINNQVNFEIIPAGGKFDTVSVDVLPTEVDAGAVNVVCLWASMINPQLVDTVPCCNPYTFPFTGYETYVPEKLTLFPNPTKEKLYFKNPFLNSEVSIFSFDGKELMKLILQTEYINVSELKTGTYLIKISDGEGHFKWGKFQKIN